MCIKTEAQAIAKNSGYSDDHIFRSTGLQREVSLTAAGHAKGSRDYY